MLPRPRMTAAATKPLNPLVLEVPNNTNPTMLRKTPARAAVGKDFTAFLLFVQYVDSQMGMSDMAFPTKYRCSGAFSTVLGWPPHTHNRRKLGSQVIQDKPHEHGATVEGKDAYCP